MFATDKKRQPGTATLDRLPELLTALDLSTLKDALLQKAFDLVERGEMEQVYWAVKAAKELKEPGTADRPEFVCRSSVAECTIDALLSGLGYDESDWEVLRGRWLTTEQAAKFAGCPPDTIRNWCRDGALHCRHDPTKKRKVWLVCPRSVACKLNNISDPRIGSQ